jgi:hypothetical protein
LCLANPALKEKSMSTKKKPKKFRTPNVPLASAAVAADRATPGLESGAESRAARVQFDYTHVTQDLRRIGILAGSIITLMVVLSFFLR